MDLTTNIIRNVYNIGTGACDAGTQYCSNGYALYFPCLKDITKGQNVCFDFYLVDYSGRNDYVNAISANPDADVDANKQLADLRDVDGISLNLIGMFNCSYGTFSYPDNISSLQTEKYPVVYRDDFGSRKLCHLKLIKIDVDNAESDEDYKSLEEDFYEGTEVELAAYNTPTHIFDGWVIWNGEEDECPEDSLYGNVISTKNIYRFVINEDTVILALYRLRKTYSVQSDPSNKSSHFLVDYRDYKRDITNKDLSNRDEVNYDDEFDTIDNVLEGYYLYVRCYPSTDVIGNDIDGDPNTTYEFQYWKDGDPNGSRQFEIGKDTKPFEDGNIIKLKAVCAGPVPYHDTVYDPEIIKYPDVDEEGIHINTEYSKIYINDFYGDEHISSASDVYQEYIDDNYSGRQRGYLYFNNGKIILSSNGIEDGIKINVYAKCEDSCTLTVSLNGVEQSAEISQDETKLYEFYFRKCGGSPIEMSVEGECLIDEIEVCKEEIIDKGKAQLCLDSETTLNLPSGKLSVNGAVVVNGNAYGLGMTQIGNVNRLPKIILNNE